MLMVLTVITAGIPFSAFAGEAAQEEGVTERCAQELVDSQSPMAQVPENDSRIDPATGKPGRPAVNLALEPFQVYSTYFDFAPINLTSVYYRNGVSYFYLELSSDNFAHYTRYRNQYGSAFSYYSSQCSISGLNPNTDYQIRLRSTAGSVFYQTSVHTGMPSLQVKSVKLKAVKVKKHRERMRTPYLGLPLRGFWVYYTYKLKVTVKLKQAPGTPGLFINGEWAGGNKKSYTVTFPGTFTWNSKKSPKKRVKLTVGIASAFDPHYGGYSPLWQKVMKAK